MWEAIPDMALAQLDAPCPTNTQSTQNLQQNIPVHPNETGVNSQTQNQTFLTQENTINQRSVVNNPYKK